MSHGRVVLIVRQLTTRIDKSSRSCCYHFKELQLGGAVWHSAAKQLPLQRSCTTNFYLLATHVLQFSGVAQMTSCNWRVLRVRSWQKAYGTPTASSSTITLIIVGLSNTQSTRSLAMAHSSVINTHYVSIPNNPRNRTQLFISCNGQDTQCNDEMSHIDLHQHPPLPPILGRVQEAVRHAVFKTSQLYQRQTASQQCVEDVQQLRADPPQCSPPKALVKCHVALIGVFRRL